MSVKEIIQTKVLIYIMGKGLEELSNTNEEFKEEFSDYDAIIQWTVADTVKMYMKVEGGKFTAFLDAVAPEPTVSFAVDDYAKAKEIFTGVTDGTSAYMSGDLKMVGDMQAGMKMGQVSSFLTETLKELMGS